VVKCCGNIVNVGRRGNNTLVSLAFTGNSSALGIATMVYCRSAHAMTFDSKRNPMPEHEQRPLMVIDNRAVQPTLDGEKSTGHFSTWSCRRRGIFSRATLPVHMLAVLLLFPDLSCFSRTRLQQFLCNVFLVCHFAWIRNVVRAFS